MIEGRLILSGTEIDISSDVAIPLSYSEADIRDPEKRKRNYSKTIAIPGSQNNMRFFSSTYMMSLSALDGGDMAGFEFDPTKKVEARYYRNEKLIFWGLARLVDVKISGGAYTFNVVLFSNFMDLFMSWKDMTIGELGWSEYDHTLSIANIEDSWDTSVIRNGSPVSNFTAGVPDGFGYLYPLAHYGYTANLRDYLTNDLILQVYLKEVMEKAFAFAGVTMDSDFFDTEIFKRLTIGKGGGQKQTISPTEKANRQSKYNDSGAYSEDYSFWNYYQNPFQYGGSLGYTYHWKYFRRLTFGDNDWSTSTVVTDTYSQFNEAEGTWYIARKGKYRLSFTGSADISTQPNTLIRLMILKNGAVTSTPISTMVHSASTVSFTSSVELDLNVGDQVSVEVWISINTSEQSTDEPEDVADRTFSFEDTSGFVLDLQSLDQIVIDGDDVQIARFLPDMKVSSLMSSVIKIFNLYLSDPDIEGVQKIEPLEDYYYGSNIFEDWTELVDHSKDIKIMPASQIKGKVYKFLWAPDEDYWNKLHRDTYGIGYGDMHYQVPSTFEEGERVWQIDFAQTIPVEVPGTNIVIPQIVNRDPGTGVESPYQGKPRIFIYSGLRNSDSWVLRNSANPATFSTYTSYPCISHLDDMDDPYFDLNFGVPEVVYWSASIYPTDNLWSDYHERSIREVTGKDSKLIELYANLDERHLQADSFRKFKMINGVLYRLNLINEFSGNTYQTTPVQLVRIIEGTRRPLFRYTLKPAVIMQGFTMDGGTDTNGADSGVSLISGEYDKIETTATINTGRKI